MPDVREVIRRLGVEIAEEGAGGRIWARCPSGTHADSNPSWSIMTSGSKSGAHYCASCHFGGWLTDLVMVVRDIGYGAAKDWLDDVAAGYGARAPVLSARVSMRPLVTPGFKVPPEVVFAPLAKWPTPLRVYAEDRGIEAWQVERWRIGYAVDGRLRMRIVVVTRDRRGRPAGYAARTVLSDPTVKRYLAPRLVEERPDLEVLFGEERWPDRGARQVAIVLEGALNALAVERCLVAHGSRASFAVMSGSRATSTVFAKLATFPCVVNLTDSDRAGNAVAEELVHGLARHVDYRRVRLRPKTDPNSITSEELWDRLCLVAPMGSSIPS